MRQGDLNTCSRLCVFEEKTKNERKKNTKISRRTEDTPRNPQQPSDRDHLETACYETRPMR